MAYEDILEMIHEPDLPYFPPTDYEDRPSGLPWEGYYYSAYGIAVKHGYTGTEEEWLRSLKGERGFYTELRYNAETNYLEWKYEDETEWHELMSLTELQTELEAATIAEVEDARDAAEGYASAASASATNAGSSASAAASSAASAAGSATSAAGSASTAEQHKNAAATSAEAASQSATAASQSASNAATSETNAAGSATAAAGSATAASGSASAASGSATAAAGSATDAAASAAEAAAILEEFTTPTASATTLEAGQPATASYADGNFTFGLPRGEQGAPGQDGQPGADGSPGADGVSPTVTVTAIAGGHRVTIEDAQGSRYFDVMDGEGSGDMTAAVYDADSSVASAGGIAAYVAAHAPAGLFYCTYGATTFAQITAALDAGKLPVCIYNNRFYMYVGLSNGYHCFTAVLSEAAYRLYVKTNWGSASFDISKVGHTHTVSNITDFPSIPSALSELTADSTHRVVTDAEKAAWNGKQDAIPANTYDAYGAAADVQSNLDEVAAKIPAQASGSNQLADKDFVNSSIENVAAYYITKDAAGNPFATKAELNAATVFYSGGAVRTPTRNDYCVVLADESKTITETGENPTTRYLYFNGWNYQYIVNRSGLTSAQWAAVTSGITSAAVSQIETNRQAIAGKQDVIPANTYDEYGAASSAVSSHNSDSSAHSDLFAWKANVQHNHTLSNITNADTVQMVVTFSDNTTQTYNVVVISS